MRRDDFEDAERSTALNTSIDYRAPDALGHFGPFGGRYVPETLIPAMDELAAAREAARHDPEFQREFA